MGFNSSRQDPMLMYLYLPAGRETGVWNASSLLSVPVFFLPDCRKLFDGDTDPTGDRTEGISDVTSGANGMKEEILTIVSGVYKTVTSETDAAESTGGGGRMLSTIPPRLILSLGTLEK
ncbi:hypothetical protein Fot_04289 [Forsythia ovata]|uniref:Uncharacterized protein n=1 Tax=Forsythia ovata TaxID=205694 RepID=A0ABD1XG68_9LAMI